MKNQWIKIVGVLLLSGALATGVNAQARNGRGNSAGNGAYGPGAKGQAYGQNDGRGYGQGYGQGQGLESPRWAALNLSDEQKEQVETMKVEHYKEMKPLRAKMVELKAAERTLMAEFDVDVKGVKSIIDQQTDLQNTTLKKGLENKLALRSVLSDRQLMQLDRMPQRPGNGRGAGLRANRPHRQNRARI